MKFLACLLTLSAQTERVIDVYRDHWSNKEISSFQGERSSFGVDTTKAKTTVPWRRCSITNGAIYKKKVGQQLHPTPIQIQCAPGFTLRTKEGEEYNRSNVVCKARRVVPEGLKCAKNPDPPVEVPKWKPGCPEPYIEDMKYNVIDKFNRNGKFGYVYELTTPVKFAKFSIAFEYPDGMTGGNFQTWNLRFYNFYKQYVLFHPKLQQVEGDNPQKHVIVLENMDFDSTPKFHLFDRIVTQHSCFTTEASGRSIADWFVPTRRFNKKEDVSKVRVDRIQGWVLPRN